MGKTQTLQAEKCCWQSAHGDDGWVGGWKNEGEDERGFVQRGPTMETRRKVCTRWRYRRAAATAHAAMMEENVAVTTIAGKPTQPIRKDRIPNARMRAADWFDWIDGKAARDAVTK